MALSDSNAGSFLLGLFDATSIGGDRRFITGRQSTSKVRRKQHDWQTGPRHRLIGS
jgi:hypothetical protein